MDLARNLIQRVNIGDSLTRSAAARPDHPAVVDGDRRWTYAEFNALVNRLAHGLAGLGYTRADALGIASGNSAEFLALYYACAKLGVVAVPINLGWRPDEVAYVLDHSGARGLAVETQLVTAMREAIGKVAGVAEVIVMPGLNARYQQEPARRTWTTFSRLSRPASTTASRSAWSKIATRSATSTRRGPPRSRRAWSARTWASTWSRCPPRSTPAGTPPTGSPR